MRLLRITTVSDDVLWVSEGDYAKGRTQIPIRCQTGTRWSDLPLGLRPSGVRTVHRGNIATAEPWACEVPDEYPCIGKVRPKGGAS